MYRLGDFKIKLNAKDFKSYLEECGVEYLYHANTVTTACTFIEAGGLLSRGAVENKGLTQTYQSSDDIDKKYNVWNDIFLDSVDLHDHHGRQNHYGPVVFKFDLDLLDVWDLPDLWVTKDNPIYWDESDTNAEKYFQSLDELSTIYRLGAVRQMITLRNTTEVLPFSNYLKEIIVDNPEVNKVEGEKVITKYYSSAIKKLRKSIAKSTFDYSGVRRLDRECSGSCFCKSNYLHQVSLDNLDLKFT